MAGYTGDWDPDERDTEGWLEEAICPKLIDFIQKILSQYPDDGQIFKEMIQNAEDAGANTVTILADTRHFHQSFNPVTLERFPHLKYFKGPALCIYNNQEFTSGDWRSIRMLHQSVKEKNPMKVGRFGLGFKSVFHLTDVVVIISGKRILYMDPSKDERHYCVAKLLCDVRGRELESILQCVEGPLFGISRETFRRGHFQGTVFWVPLRLEPTKMSASSTAYTEQNLQDLLRNFRDEGSSMLLFLNNIEQIHGYTRDSEVPQKLFSVGIAASCLQNVQCARRSFFERIPEGRGQLPTDPVYSELIVLSTETTDHVGLKREEQTSLIVNYFPGTRELSGEQQGLCTNLELNYRPCVGVAHTVHQESGLSQVFCTLPLPLGTRSMTGLPVHVNGCFAVSSNRRHLEWPDSRRRREFFESTVQWNLFLVEVLLPRAYARLLENIVQMRSVSAQWFYSIWPDISRADARWRLLAENVYRKLATKSCFFTEADGGKYIRLNQAVLSRFPSEVPLDVAKTIVNVCKKNSVNLVELPAHVEKDLDLQGFLAHVRCVNPNDVCRLLHNCLHDLNREERLNVLEYLCLLGATSDLENLELLPLADGTFGVFSRRSPNEIYWCDERLLSLFPDMLSRFCDTNLQSALRQYLFRIAVSGTFSLRVLSDDSSDVPRLVRENLVTRSGHIAPTLSLGDAWIEQVWRFLSATRPWDQNLEMFKQFALLPAVSGHVLKLLPLTGVYVCLSSHGVCDALSPDLCSCLTKLQVTVLQDVPYCVQWHRCYGQLVQPPSADGILRVLEQIARKSNLCVAAVQQFNSHASERERNELVGLLEKVWVIDSDCRNFLRQLKMFKQAGGGQYVSVQEVNCIAPDDFPPMLPRQKFLCCSRRSEYVAVALGARQTTLKEIVADMLMLMLGSSLHGYSSTDVSKFMNFFIDRRDLLDDQSLLSVARQVKFVRTTQGHVKAADELYDPTSPDLAELFEALDLLPSADFRRPTVLEKLQLLGLRTEANVQEEHLLAAAVHINTEFCRGVLAALRKSNALWALLVKYGNNFTPTTLERISHIQCMPCLQAEEKPMGYPESLPLKSTPALVKSEELYTHTRVRLIGSVVPIARSDISEHVSSMLQINTQMYLDHVVQHLRHVTNHYTLGEAPQYRLLLIEIFTVLTQHTHNTAVERLKKEKCALVESGDRFVRPCNVWTEKGEDDIDLKPYRFPLASYLHTFKGLFLSCGSHQSQDEAMLRDVIVEIQRKHERLNVTPEKCSDLKLVKKILNRLKEEDSACDGTVLIPVQIPENPLALRFKPAKDCTIVSGGMEAASSRSAAIYIVNPQITPDTARALGALDMRARAMEGLEAIDFGYGQREDLIDRLKDLLEHSYRDGLSVPKELIQNADDAGARKVFFLLDERENPDARSNLFYPQMASQQGPAVWAYNDAKFSDKDIANITRLGAQTKEDASKVGKFGLGFNAVYNLTDTPCYLSGHFMGMFDPEGKYLGGNPGMKLNFRDPQNQALVSCMPQQFEPFQGIFGCHLKDDGTPISYEGTLFRFPLRTPQQEAESRLNAKCYNREKRREFLKLILESAGNLLMFTQSVHVLEIFHIADDNSDPGSPDCLLSMSKTSKRLHGVSLGETAILQFCTHRWQTQQDIKIYEELDVNVKMTNIAEDLCEVKACDSTTHWRVAWATGTGESAGIARSRSHRNQSLLPLAAVAVPLDKGCILQLDQLPPGFYRTGHLFCFLPLPEELGHGALPVHVNSTFSLTSSRRSLLEQTEDDVDSLKTKWNRALFVDPVCRAYILLLESLQGVAQKDDYSAYFHLWPQAASATVQEMKVSFYKHVTAGGSMLFPVPHTGRWVDFQTARFLEPTFRDSECGSIALKVLQKFWKGDGSIVDVPKNICLLIKAAEEKAFKTKVVTKAAFYKDVFFPNIKDDWWKLDEREKERDRLILHAVLQDHQDIQRLLRNHQCIPCEGTPDLRRPGDLIHPEKEAAKLFLPSEGFFPQCKDPNENTHVVHFRSKKILERLAKLGMTTDDLSPDRVLERTKSVAALFAFAESRQLALDRACRVVDYMSSYSALHSKLRIDLLPPETKAAFSDIMFLPVLRKPEHWPFPWEGDADQPELASPSSLFVDRLRDLVACNAKLLNSHSLGYAGSQQEEKTRVLALLGVGVDKDHENKQLLTLTIAQLKTIAGEYRKYRSINKETLQAVLVAIYSFLDQCLGFSPQTAVFISEHLASVECVWAENEFVLPRHVAFHSKFDCRPYLYKLEGNLEQYMRLFEKLGVKEKFSTTDGLDVLKCIHEEKAGSQLSEDEVRLVGRVAQMVCEATQDDGDSIDKSQVFLPDRECFMCPVDGLCFDDTDWLSPNDSMRFLNGKIPLETARILGVKTKKREDFVRMAKALPWAQKEELTTRIKRLLQGYTFDSSILQELIQNAEDARATEIHFIKDFRNLSTERVVEGCSFLQGPALCVYNNSFFTEEDLKGIISLGEGSKGLEPLKVGQYGVGFNAVYHLTDIPSFWTRRDDGKEVMVVLDPNCQHLPVEGGVRLEEIDQNSYSDTFQGFLRDCQPEYMSKPGTLFRFPLRTEEMAKTSQIKDLPVTESQLTEMMDSFVEEMERCLLFLNSVRSIGIYTVSEEGTLKRECQVAKQLDEPSHKELRRFQCYLEEAAAKLREGAQPTDIEEFESVLFMSIKNSRDCAEEWLTVNRIGFASMARREQMQTNFRGENFKCLPSGGVAVQLSESSAGGQAPPPTKDCLAFCVLPLPVCTGLPMHINGHFALDHGTRRGLWDNKDDARTAWNKAIALQIVVPAYITAIQRVKNVWFSADEGGTRLTSTYLQHYHSLFPDLQNAFSTYPWKLLMEELYRQIARLELPLFPVVREDISIITWAPVVKTDGFPGYFSDSVKFFKEVLPVTKDSDKRKAEKRNVLSSIGC
ncbi:hypothetical protein BaRGS_00013313 [Batillaria attramentaria]|uniref:Sacsin/Nov domain-containing protein n=1 Tax=Batillaria attramentaria TaxID=370345 RepID=A0ABD0L6Z6_9CAEN